MTGRRLRLLPIATLLLLGCSAPSDPESWEDHLAALRSCPRGDAQWRPALGKATSQERLEELLAVTSELAARHPDRWEPEWAAAESLFRLRRPGDAGPRYQESLERARAGPDDAGIACNANRLGWLSHQAGDVAAARTLYDEALASALSAERVDLASFVRNNLAGLLMDSGDFLRAASVVEEAADGLRSLGYEGPALVADFNRAVLLLELGDAVAVRERLEAIRGTAVQAADPDIEHASAVLLGYVHLMLGDADGSIRWFNEVGGGDTQIRALAKLGLGRAEVRRGNFAEAVRMFEASAEEAGDEYRADALLAETFGANALLLSGRTREAESRLRALLAGADTAQVAGSLWAVHWILGKVLLESGRPEEAIGSLGRSLELLEEQGAALDPMTNGMRFLKKRADAYVDLARAEVRLPASTGSAGRVLAVSTRAKARALRSALGSGGDVDRAAGLETLQAGLGGDEILIDYLVGEDGGVALAVTTNTVRTTEIPGRRDLAPRVRAFREALRDDAEDPAPIGLALREDLLDPFEDLLDRAGRFLVVPDRDLALLPMAALPGREGGFVGDRLDVASLPLAAPPARWSDARSPVLVAGQPDLAGSGFADLPWAAYEASRLQELWGEEASEYLGGGAFSLEGLRSAGLQRYRTLHLSTHALASTRDPRRSGIILSKGERLGLREILELPLDSPLVVLSACRTGEGELVPGEGVLGLTWAFLQAGADGIVATQWTIDDAAAARLMVSFHRRLHDGTEPMAALAGARRELAREGASPGLWAPFFLTLRPGAV